jgi:hypothetical protein
MKMAQSQLVIRERFAWPGTGRILKRGLPNCGPEKSTPTSGFSAAPARRFIQGSQKRPVKQAFRDKSENNSLSCRLYGGEGGIRTPGALSGTAVFKTACFNHSHTSPRDWYQQFTSSRQLVLKHQPSIVGLSFHAEIWPHRPGRTLSMCNLAGRIPENVSIL